MVVEVDVKVEGPGDANVHNNAFYAEEKLLKSELEAMRDCNPSSARHWILSGTSTKKTTAAAVGLIGWFNGSHVMILRWSNKLVQEICMVGIENLE
ncbi:hypothetical protein L1987_79375 [Smallanthus sonchifolius]|uniref:Uncharacterized protein n=1 Tax=Smallanthus sonchifolius TaxID=185202 RepID=A0ACB8ZFV1_9ASTR|nr:hypothetical protein L1987_79375 [Smallanthus sonchifolius]